MLIIKKNGISRRKLIKVLKEVIFWSRSLNEPKIPLLLGIISKIMFGCKIIVFLSLLKRVRKIRKKDLNGKEFQKKIKNLLSNQKISKKKLIKKFEVINIWIFWFESIVERTIQNLGLLSILWTKKWLKSIIRIKNLEFRKKTKKKNLQLL